MDQKRRNKSNLNTKILYSQYFVFSIFCIFPSIGDLIFLFLLFTWTRWWYQQHGSRFSDFGLLHKIRLQDIKMVSFKQSHYTCVSLWIQCLFFVNALKNQGRGSWQPLTCRQRQSKASPIVETFKTKERVSWRAPFLMMPKVCSQRQLMASFLMT